MAEVVTGDYDIRSRDLDQRFASFGLRQLTDEDGWALGMASMVVPDGSPGCAGFLTQVSGVDVFSAELAGWGRMVAACIAEGRHKAKTGKRHRAYVEGYQVAWGRFAVADGLALALFGNAPGIVERTDALGVGRQPYQRIRDFVGGTLVVAVAEFRCALEWALGWRRDRVFAGRWEGVTGLNWDETGARATMGREGAVFCLSSGAGRTPVALDSDERMEPDPETLYPAIRASACWSEGYARKMRRECPVRIIYSPPRT